MPNHTTPPATPTKLPSGAINDNPKHLSSTTPRHKRGSQSGTGTLCYEQHTLEVRREWLRESTTCYELHPSTFLNKFLPPPKKDSYVTRVMQRLRKKKILTGAGWSRLMQQDVVMKEHDIFNEPLEEIINTIIQVLPNCQGKLSLYDVSYALMLRLDNRDALNSLGSLPGIFLVADGFRPFVAKCPDVSRSDGALLFLHQAKSRPTKDEPAPSDQPKTPAGQTRYPWKVKMCPIIAAEESQVEKRIHLEDVIACLQFKPKDEVS
jgi:hypothetical protein